MNIILWIIGVLLCLLVGYLWVVYKLMVGTAVLLRSAGKMKTGNDLQEQIEDTVANETIPGFFKFYWIMYKKVRE